MAKTKGIEKPRLSEVEKGFRSFRADTTGFYELNEGETLKGVFLGRRQATIKDKRTKAMKEIWVYRLRDEEGKIINLGGRSLLDRAYDDMVDEAFGSSESGVKGLRMQINRGENSKTSEGNPMGTYEILIEDPDQAHDEK